MVVTISLIAIYEKSKREGLDFYEQLDKYLQMIREVHLKTYEYLGSMKASCNPLLFMYGGLYGGNLKADECIAPVLAHASASFGFLGLNELQLLHNGKTIREDGQFAYEVMEYMNKKVEEYKKKDGKLYGIYGTPSESLAGKQYSQFVKLFGDKTIISTKGYLTNSFHMAVSEPITGIEKQNLEKRFYDLSAGGRIQYVRYANNYNKEAIKATVRHAMQLGYYEGVNIAQCFCEDCGEKFNDADTCPKCGSSNLTKIDRVCGLTKQAPVLETVLE